MVTIKYTIKIFNQYFETFFKQYHSTCYIFDLKIDASIHVRHNKHGHQCEDHSRFLYNLVNMVQLAKSS